MHAMPRLEPLQITAIRTRIIQHRLRPERVIVTHAGAHDTSRFLTVTVEGKSGAHGYGEAATTPLWDGETAETAQWTIENLFAPKLRGATIADPREVVRTLDSLTYGMSFAKAALDQAIWDLFCCERSVRAVSLFQDREPVASIPTRASLGTYPAAETLRIAEGFWAAGIRTLKFKIGMAGVDDVARLRAVRERFGNEPVFTLDANGAYRTVDEAVRALEKLLPYNVALIEQPLPRERIGGCAKVRKRIPVPFIIDEGVFTPDHLAEAIDLDAFDVLSIYPGKNGGVSRSIEMATAAQRAGKACALGCNLETDLGQAAMAAVAAGLSAFPVERFACDLPAAIFYERSSIGQPMTFANGRVGVPTGPGFGVDPLES
jgi:L-alanine-DL-glutamate epimerase-like enolase superfamily enzyme